MIGKCRDLITSNDYKLILGYIGVFDNLVDLIRRQVEKFVKNDNYELDFTPYDLQELSDEILDYIKDIQHELTFSAYEKEIMKFERIDNKVLDEFTKQKADRMYLDRKLRESYKVLSYFGLVALLYSKSRENNNGQNN
ncbi:MAG: hypothetical protein II304_02660 [Bacteroidales bacterium]|nr:hypothetical protein [Bacteroidales bacterium]